MLNETIAQRLRHRLHNYLRDVFPGYVLQRAFFVILAGIILMAYWKHG
jgi:hypothetical protein